MHGMHGGPEQEDSGDPLASALRALPQVQRLLETPEAAALLARLPRPAVVDALRAAVDAARADLQAGIGGPPSPASIVARAAQMLDSADPPGLRRVLNATGIVLHTNLGRSPIAEEAAQAAYEAARLAK